MIANRLSQALLCALCKVNCTLETKVSYFETGGNEEFGNTSVVIFLPTTQKIIPI